MSKRGDGRWEGRYKKGRKENGTILYGSIYGKTCKEVKKKLGNVPKQTLKVENNKRNSKTFGEVLELWMQNNRVHLKGASINKYQKLIDTHIITELGNIKVTEITSAMINAFLTNKLNSGCIDGTVGLSASYVRSIMYVISAALKCAVQEQLCEPLKTSISKPLVQSKELQVLSLSSQKQLEKFILDNITPTEVGIYISLYTGLRIGEICALRWNDIDLLHKIIKVRHTIARVNVTMPNSSNKSSLIIDTPKKSINKENSNFLGIIPCFGNTI